MPYLLLLIIASSCVRSLAIYVFFFFSFLFSSLLLRPRPARTRPSSVRRRGVRFWRNIITLPRPAAAALLAAFRCWLPPCSLECEQTLRLHSTSAPSVRPSVRSVFVYYSSTAAVGDVCANHVMLGSLHFVSLSLSLLYILQLDPAHTHTHTHTYLFNTSSLSGGGLCPFRRCAPFLEASSSAPGCVTADAPVGGGPMFAGATPNISHKYTHTERERNGRAEDKRDGH